MPSTTSPPSDLALSDPGSGDFARPHPHLAHGEWHPIEPPEYGMHFRRGRELIAAVTPWRGRWLSMVNLHASALRIRHAPCASREQGMRWVERWAAGVAGRAKSAPSAGRHTPPMEPSP